MRASCSIFMENYNCVMIKVLEFEHKSRPLLPIHRFYNRMIFNLIVGMGILSVSLGIGVIGYHFTCFEATGERLSWLDSLLNASMILSGMGPLVPVDDMSDAGKWFASFYAIFSGVMFISTIGILLAPLAHRMLHRFHLQDENEKP